MALLATVLIGWPAMLVSLCLLAWSMSAYRPRTAMAAALFGTPFLLYFSMTPRFRYVAPLALCAYYAAPVAIAYRQRAIAFVCAAPFVALVVSAAWFVVRSHANAPMPW